MTLQSALLHTQEETGCNAFFAVQDLTSGEVLAVHREDTPVPSASLIKLSLLLCALEAVQKGELSFDRQIPICEQQHTGDSRTIAQGVSCAPLSFLIETMIVDSDNTAANVLIDFLGMERVNALCKTCGMLGTCLRRHMLDFEAAARGEENNTTARDILRFFSLLQEDAVLTPALCETARRILLAQRDKAYLMYAMPKQRAAHKTGELPGIRHDAGILYGRKRTVGFSVLTQADNENSGTAFLRQAGVLLRSFL